MLDLEEVLAFAEERHRGQFRDSGEPYIVHPTRVGEILREILRETEPDEEKREDIEGAAYSHDLFEDTGTKYKELKQRFGPRMANLVGEVTSSPIEKKLFGKARYLSRRMSSMTSDALTLKLADRLDNVSDMDCYSKGKRQEKYAETREIINYLETKRELTDTHKKLIERIKKVINAAESSENLER